MVESRPTVLPDRSSLNSIVIAVERGLAEKPAGPLAVGICGAQGSGKSTIAAALKQHFDTQFPTAVMSIDDLYRTREEREMLAKQVHPLLRTRGVPGTHDISLGLAVLDGIRSGQPTAIPRFDKATDDRRRQEDWDTSPSDTRLVILEGWCVAAKPEPDSALADPLNDLERVEDPDGRWRRYVNAALAGEYVRLFTRLDILVFLAAPTFETTFSWRIEQEQHMHARTGRGMTDDEVFRFVRHYERVTRHILREMSSRADVVVQLDIRRRPVRVTYPKLSK